MVETYTSPLYVIPETGLFIRGNVFFLIFKERCARDGGDEAACVFIIFIIIIIIIPRAAGRMTIGDSLGLVNGLQQRSFSRAVNLERLDEKRSTGGNLFGKLTVVCFFFIIRKFCRDNDRL